MVTPESRVHPECQDYFRFVGRFLGKVIFDHHTVDVHFARVVYKYLLGRPIEYEVCPLFARQQLGCRRARLNAAKLVSIHSVQFAMLVRGWLDRLTDAEGRARLGAQERGRSENQW